MINRVMRSLFVLAVMNVVMLIGTTEHAQGGCKYWGRIGGSLTCLAYTPGSVDIEASIDCIVPEECSISSPVKVHVSIFGNISPENDSNQDCDFNPHCSMAGTLSCDGVKKSINLKPSDVNFPLTAKANMNCQSGSCTTNFEIELKKCHGKAENCCFGPQCCSKKTKKIAFTPDGFDALGDLFIPPGQAEPETPQLLTIEDPDCRKKSYHKKDFYKCACVEGQESVDCAPLDACKKHTPYTRYNHCPR